MSAKSTRVVPLLLLTGAALLVLSMLGIVLGTTNISVSGVSRVLGSKLLPQGWVDASRVEPVDRAIIWSLRLPRVVLAAMVGAALSTAGAQLQGLFRNPLASPSVIGTTAGASLGAVLALSLGLGVRSMFYVPLFAIVFAFLSLLLVTAIAARVAEGSVSTLLLAGIAVTAFIGAINSYIIARSWEQWEVARRIAFWLMGGVMDRDWTHVALLAPGLVVGLVLAIYHGPALDLLLEGEEVASSLGVEVTRTRRLILMTSALLTGSAVAVSGVVGFVGLVIPHLVRLWLGPAHRPLLAVSATTGAAFLIAADLVARTAARPTEIHLGVVTAFVGAPFFLSLLLRGKAGL